MSKTEEIKKKQGFTKQSPKCSNCIYFKSEKVEQVSGFGVYIAEKNMRCTLGNFAVGKSNYCNLHHYE